MGQAGTALGDALAPLLRGDRGPGRGLGSRHRRTRRSQWSSSRPRGPPLVASNADLTSTRAGGLAADLAATFLHELAEAAGLTVHVRLFEGENSQHVLSAIFKALGIAIADAAGGGT